MCHFCFRCQAFIFIFTSCTGNKDPRPRLPWCIWKNQPIPGGCQSLPSSSRNLPYPPQLNGSALHWIQRAFVSGYFTWQWIIGLHGIDFSVTLINYHVVRGWRNSDFPSTSSVPGPWHVEAILKLTMTCWRRPCGSVLQVWKERCREVKIKVA